MEQRHHGVDDGRNQHDGADGAVETQDAAHTEVLLHAVNHVSQPEPPKHRAAHNGDVAHALPEEVAGYDKGEHVVEGDEEEDNQRVGERNEKRSREVVQQRALFRGYGAQALARVGAEEIQPEDEEHDAADEFHPEEVALVVDKVHHERHAEARDEGVDEIAQCRARAGDEAVVAPLLHGALYAQNAHGTHGGGGDNSY